MTVTTIQTNFTGGEQSPRLRSRIDVDKWNNGVEIMVNMQSLIHGGARSTPGTEFIAETKDSTKTSFLLKFEFSRTQSLMLEIGEFYIRFFDQAGVAIPDPITPSNPFEIVTVYTEAQLVDIKFTSSKDTIILFHENVHPQRLRRFADDDWVIDNLPFDPQPVDELGHRFNEAMTLGATTGTGISCTVDSVTSIFLVADIGRTISFNGGLAIITAQTGVACTVDIVTDFLTTAIPANLWTLDFSPQVDITPNVSGPFGGAITLTASATAWRAEDVGSYVDINGGLVRIDTFTSNLIVAGTIRKELSSTAASPADAWVLRQPIFTTILGFPRCGIFFKQRLVLAGSTFFPNTFWASRIRLFFDFEQTGLDDGAIFFELDLEDSNPILDIGLRSKQMVMLSSGGETLVSGDADGVFTPTIIDTNNASAFGSKGVKSLRVKKDLVFVQRGGVKVRAVEYNFGNDEFDAVELTKLAEHITYPSIVDMSYQQEPDTILWLVRSDGVAVCLTIDRDETIIAASRQTTEGTYEAVEAMPGTNGLDDLWCIVKRNIDGNDVRYIERFKESIPSVHAAVEATNGSPITVWSGFTHLEGETVGVVVDDILRTPVVVSGGQITVPSGTKIVAGLPLPDRPGVKLYQPEFSDETGVAQGSRMNINKVIVGLFESGAMLVNGQPFDGRRFDTPNLDQPAPVLTGDFELPDSGWEVNKTATIEAATILPIHLLSVKRRVIVARQT